MNGVEILLIVVGLFCGFLGFMLPNTINGLKQKGKVRVYFTTGDSLTWEPTYHKPVGDEIVYKYGGKERRAILEGSAKYACLPATWIMNPVTGHCYRPPRLSEVLTPDAAGERALRLLASNPENYHLRLNANSAAEAMNANIRTDDRAWIKPAIIGGTIFLCLMALVVGYAVLKISSATGH